MELINYILIAVDICIFQVHSTLYYLKYLLQPSD
uniref:Uncharacterized protein n=1 Tax=Arundo donax TaxID=35708 RepID=A0A0A8ZT56_ARUDO